MGTRSLRAGLGAIFQGSSGREESGRAASAGAGRP
jgi:hypothetical protein